MHPTEHLEFKVKNTTAPQKIATAIVMHTMKGDRLFLSTIGAGALNQATKGAIIASQRLIADGITLSMRPAFFNLDTMMPVEATEETVEGFTEDRKTVIRLFLDCKYG